MKKTAVLAVLLSAGCFLTGCGQFRATASNDAQAVELDSEKSSGLIELVGDYSVGPEETNQTEVDIVVPDADSEEANSFLETESAAQDVEAAEAEGAGAADQAGAKAETEADAQNRKAAADETEAESVKAAAAESETEAETEAMKETETEKALYGGPIDQILDQVVNARVANGENWAIGYEDLSDGTIYGYNDDEVLQSASVVKLFIMGTVYRYMCYPDEGEQVIEFHEEYDGQLRDTIENMITVSDNDCANLLIERLGQGDFMAGAELINTFCKENGFPGTSVGRRFLGDNSTGDNYTTAADTRKFLSDIYHGRLVNEEASEKMLTIVKGQTRKNKIPAGLPAGFTSGNKTGEMPEGYNLGCIENDSAIIFPPEGSGEGYILTVMSTNLGGRNDQAIGCIGQISSITAQWYLDNLNQSTTESENSAAQSGQPATENGQPEAQNGQA